MRIYEILKGKAWYKCGISARILTVGHVWIKKLRHILTLYLVNRGISALHFVEYYALVAHLVLALVKLVMPALLHKYLGLLYCKRMQHRIHIHVDKIVKILVTA